MTAFSQPTYEIFRLAASTGILAEHLPNELDVLNPPLGFSGCHVSRVGLYGVVILQFLLSCLAATPQGVWIEHALPFAIRNLQRGIERC